MKRPYKIKAQTANQQHTVFKTSGHQIIAPEEYGNKNKNEL